MQWSPFTFQDRLKTAEEIIAEEKSRLEKLELDRIRRMKGDFDPEIDGDEEEQEGENNSVRLLIHFFSIKLEH